MTCLSAVQFNCKCTEIALIDFTTYYELTYREHNFIFEHLTNYFEQLGSFLFSKGETVSSSCQYGFE